MDALVRPNYTTSDRRAAHKKSDQRRDDLCAVGLRKRVASLSLRPFISFWRCRVESKRGRIRPGVKHWEITLAILTMLSASLAVADDFKTSNRKEYKNATVTRVEPDGIVIKFRGGIVKLPFSELGE